MTLLAAALLLGALSAGWVVLPMIRRRMAAVGDPLAGGVIDADARKRVALASLSEIEYDRIGGKLDDEDYHRLRAQLEREALLAIEAADAATGSAVAGASAVAPLTSAPPRIVNPAAASSGSAPAPAAADRTRDEPAFTVTHACGFVNPPGSRFCSGCGARL